MNILTFGEVDQRSLEQLKRCYVHADHAVLCADHHVGYSQPIGGAIAYDGYVSPSGVGYDIACGNKAVLTDLMAADIDVAAIMDEIVRRISFGIGRKSKERADHPVLDKIANASFEPQRGLLKLAVEQLGTVGSGNHFVDLFSDDQGRLWVGVHLGSRGFGHRTTSGFLSIVQGKRFEEKPKIAGMDAEPVLFEASSQLGQDYIASMNIAGEYAYAGRDIVVDLVVVKILGANILEEVHNHHNFAWRETHFGKEYWVVRKGCTPAFPYQKCFVGSTMDGTSVVLEGIDSELSRKALYTTIHGAGRVMSRRQAAGRFRRRGRKKIQVQRGVVNFDRVKREIKEKGIELRGSGADEAPEVYKDLFEVLKYHKGTVKVLHELKPVGVAMAGADIFGSYKD